MILSMEINVQNWLFRVVLWMSLLWSESFHVCVCQSKSPQENRFYVYPIHPNKQATKCCSNPTADQNQRTWNCRNVKCVKGENGGLRSLQFLASVCDLKPAEIEWVSHSFSFGDCWHGPSKWENPVLASVVMCCFEHLCVGLAGLHKKLVVVLDPSQRMCTLSRSLPKLTFFFKCLFLKGEKTMSMRDSFEKRQSLSENKSFFFVFQWS